MFRLQSKATSTKPNQPSSRRPSRRPSRPAGTSSRRRVKFESLEDRVVLSGIGLGTDVPRAQYFLVDTTTDETITEITAGSIVPTDLVEGRRVSIFAIANEANSESSEIDSARLQLNDGPGRRENVAPYSLGGDWNGNFWNGQSFTPGEYNLEVEFYNRNNLRGDLIEAVDLAFRVSDLPEVQDAEVVLHLRDTNSLTLFAETFLTEPTMETYYFQSAVSTENGSVSIGGSGSALFYSPQPGFVGVDTVTVTLWNQQDPNDTVTAQLTVRVTELPQVQSLERTVNSEAGSFALFLDAPTFIIGGQWEPLFYFESPQTDLGGFTLAGEGSSLLFTPESGNTGTDTITIKLWNQTNFDDFLTVELTLNVI